ncbi:MAG: AAA family ATPase [Blautia sp.]|nr:AAA family ATPase [Blautia sp.]
MGTYLNPGKTAFEEVIHSEIYVDKTEMIQFINSVVKTEQKYICVSRPRRFGKTVAAKMLCAYYDRKADSRELFETRKLAGCPEVHIGDKVISWDTYLGQFDVIRLVMTDFLEDSANVEEMLSYLTEEVTEELMNDYPEINFGKRINLRTVMNKIYGTTGRQFVVIIDEWDAVFRVWKNDSKGQTKYLDFLRDWLKNKDYLSLTYMTGILPIKKYGEHSALNMFDEYSMNAPMQLAAFTGFTEKEVEELCHVYEMDFESVSNWYDGYRLSDMIPVDMRRLFRQGDYEGRKISIYNPLSVVKAMRSGSVDNYWNKTETYEALADYIRLDYDGLKETIALLMDGGRVKVNLKAYQNDMMTFHSKDDILALLIHLGYLGYEGRQTQRGIDSEHGEVFIPNKEILDEFKTSTNSQEWVSAFQAFDLSMELLKATWAMKEDKVAELVENAHNQVESKTYNDEKALSFCVQLAYYAAQKYYTTILELATGKGYADIAYLPSPKYPNFPALLLELKYDKDETEGLEQIYRQKYMDRLKHYKGNLLLIAITYSKDRKNDSPEFKHHRCRIVKA